NSRYNQLEGCEELLERVKPIALPRLKPRIHTLSAYPLGQKCKFQITFSMSHTENRYTRIQSMKFRLSIAVAIAVFAAAMFASPVLAQMSRINISGPIAQTRISSGFGVRRVFPRARIGFGHINRSQFFPGSFLYPPY